MFGLHHAIAAFVRARWLQRRLRTRGDITAYQRARLAAFVRDVERTIPFYRERAPAAFEAWPLVDKQVLLADFARFNRAGLTLEQVRSALEAGHSHVGGLAVGHSTGTSGNRGFYVISDAERFVWLGTLLAKALPDAIWRRHRVALALPGFSSLYRTASSGSRITLGFFDLAEGVDRWAGDLLRFAPDAIVAPPKVLRLLAERDMLTARTIFSSAEVLDPIDRTRIEAATGRRVREIYMATEGLFGVACPNGTLHLAEDVVHFEWEESVSDSPLRMPIVTDFTRRAQALARYRMNDLIELDDRACACGSPLQAVRRIEGRRDDIFLLEGSDGRQHPVTPDVLRNAVVDADRRIDDFRIIQTGSSAIELRLDATLPRECGEAAAAAIARLASRLRLAPVAVAVRPGLAIPYDAKLRRVARAWRPD